MFYIVLKLLSLHIFSHRLNIHLYLFFVSSLHTALKSLIVSLWIALVCVDIECTSLRLVLVWDKEDAFDLYLVVANTCFQQWLADPLLVLNHDCVGEIGPIERGSIDSNDILSRKGHITLNGGNRYTNWFSQLIDIASTDKSSGSGIQEA